MRRTLTPTSQTNFPGIPSCGHYPLESGIYSRPSHGEPRRALAPPPLHSKCADGREVPALGLRRTRAPTRQAYFPGIPALGRCPLESRSYSRPSSRDPVPPGLAQVIALRAFTFRLLQRRGCVGPGRRPSKPTSPACPRSGVTHWKAGIIAGRPVGGVLPYGSKFALRRCARTKASGTARHVVLERRPCKPQPRACPRTGVAHCGIGFAAGRSLENPVPYSGHEINRHVHTIGKFPRCKHSLNADLLKSGSRAFPRAGIAHREAGIIEGRPLGTLYRTNAPKVARRCTFRFGQNEHAPLVPGTSSQGSTGNAETDAPLVIYDTTLRQTNPRTEPEGAMCVQRISAQCVLQFTPSIAAGCVLHRPENRVIHRLESCIFV